MPPRRAHVGVRRVMSAECVSAKGCECAHVDDVDGWMAVASGLRRGLPRSGAVARAGERARVWRGAVPTGRDGRDVAGEYGPWSLQRACYFELKGNKCTLSASLQ